MRRSAVIWALLCCVVLVNGLMAAPSVSHAGHHEDHQATTHSTEMCAWFCAAAQGVESASVQLHPQLQPIERTTVAASDSRLLSPAFHSRFRGPPISIVIAVT